MCFDISKTKPKILQNKVSSGPYKLQQNQNYASTTQAHAHQVVKKPRTCTTAFTGQTDSSCRAKNQIRLENLALGSATVVWSRSHEPSHALPCDHLGRNGGNSLNSEIQPASCSDRLCSYQSGPAFHSKEAGCNWADSDALWDAPPTSMQEPSMVNVARQHCRSQSEDLISRPVADQRGAGPYPRQGDGPSPSLASWTAATRDGRAGGYAAEWLSQLDEWGGRPALPGVGEQSVTASGKAPPDPFHDDWHAW